MIVGGKETISNNAVLQTVVIYDITKNECKELAPLPYPVSIMATVKWGDDHVVIMGGEGTTSRPRRVTGYQI